MDGEVGSRRLDFEDDLSPRIPTLEEWRRFLLFQNRFEISLQKTALFPEAAYGQLEKRVRPFDIVWADGNILQVSRIANIQFISVNFNNAAYSKQLLASVERQRGRDNTFTVKCVIVDNSTNDADRARVVAELQRSVDKKCAKRGASISAPTFASSFGGYGPIFGECPMVRVDATASCH